MNELILAYTNTTYRVFTLDPFDLTIGQQSKPLSDLMQFIGTECCAFLTAYNPWSIETHVGANEEQHAELCAAVYPAPFFEGVGFSMDPCTPWMPERGILLMQQEYPDTAYMLARKFNQHAFVWCSEYAVPQLLLTANTEIEHKLTVGARLWGRGGS